MSDSSFERAFSELAHATLRENAPGLMEHLVGFQILDQNDDESRAIGIFGFKIGDQWFYAPTFFLNGALKGTDLLYIKNQDMFVPLLDNWVNYLLSKKPPLLGGPETKEEQELDLEHPSFNSLTDKPQGNKWASLQWEGWAKEGMTAITRTLTKYAGKQVNTDLYHVLSKEPGFSIPLTSAMTRSYKFAEAVLNYYPDLLQHLPAPKEAKKAFDRMTGVKKTAGTEVSFETLPEEVKVYSPSSQIETIAKGVLTSAEKEKLLRGEVVIKDHRSDGNKSKVYHAEVDKNITNPSCTGDYDVVMTGGEWKNCLVVVDPILTGRGSIQGVSVIVTDKGARLAESKKVYIKAGEPDPKDKTDRYDSASSISGMENNKYYMLVTPEGKLSIPFQVINKTSSSDGLVRYAVQPYTRVIMSDCCDVAYGREGNREYELEVTGTFSIDKEREEEDWNYKYGLHELTVSDRDNVKLTYTKHGAIIPADTKVISVEIPEENSIALADIEDISECLMKSASKMDIYKDGPEFVIRSKSGRIRLSKEAATCYFIKDCGTSVEGADYILKTASKRPTPYLIKLANPFMGSAPGAPGMPAYNSSYDADIGAPVQGPQTDVMSVDGMEAGDNEDVYDLKLDEEVQNMLSAAESGQKDVFDAAALGSLVKAVDIDSVIDSFIPEIIQGMDRVGRTLFVYYWHPDSFRERFGREELPELEDALRNVFKAQGDLVMFLKRKTINADPVGESLRIDLEDIA